MPTEIRPATSADAVTIASIYAHYVTETVVTFDQTPPNVDQWRDHLGQLARDGWPVLVVASDEQVYGYAYVAPWRPRPAYRYTVENSIYVDSTHLGQGHGRRLLNKLLPAAAAAGARQVIAVIADTGAAAASLALHRTAGFTPAGRLRRVGYKHHRWLDTVLLQRDLVDFGGMLTFG
ncbi:MAG: GNAT family N-acetyltransferase [Pseudonocardiaceae bacterium]